MITALAKDKFLVYWGELFNALSLTLFSGSFISLVINLNKKESKNNKVTDVLSRYTYYSFLAMIGGALVNAFFSINKLVYLWLMASLFCFLLGIVSIFLIRGDLKTDIRHRNQDSLKKLLVDMKLLKKIFLSRKIIFVFLMGIIMGGFFAVIINYNQIATYHFLPDLNKSYFHSIVFIPILLMQALAGIYLKKFHPKIQYINLALILLFLFLYISSNSSIKNINYLGALNQGLFIFIYFFYRILMVIILGYFHDHVSSSIRATADSCLNTLSYLISIGLALTVSFFYKNIEFIYIMGVVIFLIIYFLNLVPNDHCGERGKDQ